MKRIVTIALVACGAVLGCVTPSVPVPPPEPEAMSFALDVGAGTATYQANLGADWVDSWVVVLVDRTGDGTVLRSDANGLVGPSEPFQATEGDRVSIEFKRDDGYRQGVCLILHPGASSDAFVCP